MNTQKETLNTDNGFDTRSHNHREPVHDTQKERWLQTYASRILMAWSHWQTPLGVACAYTHKIKMDLARFYDDPLKRMLIEATYYAPSD
ncbi:MAG: hypothetical protein JXM79_11965 [Sedimentisphaerales bacterium]|nr:hypothetical protein [Sedimentisphaerales bacterium]